MLRFKLTPTVSSPASSFSLWPLKLFAVALFVLVGLGMVGGWLLRQQGRRAGEYDLDTGPVILAMQRIGQLHTVSYSMKDVLNHETAQEVEGWAAALPGAEGLLHWATRNKALVIAEGQVEAGVDLTQVSEKSISQVRLADGSTGLRVLLPPITVYPPNVRVRVEQNQTGLFWRDENIVPKAQAEVSRRFLMAAEKDNIRLKAQENALQQLRRMQSLFGDRKIEFSFPGEKREAAQRPSLFDDRS